MEHYYNYIKALHIIFIITWFAGLFYLPRLFIYTIEASKKPPLESKLLTEQLNLMSKRLMYIITLPSALLSLVFGLWMLWLMPEWLKMGWMHIKLSFVILLIAYQIKTYKMFLDIQRGIYRKSSTFMRFWNEGATLLLVSIVFLVVLKNQLNWLFGLIGFIALILLLSVSIKIYKKIRR